MTGYREFHRRSIAEREAFWREEAQRIEWKSPFSAVLDYSHPPFARWFVGGRTNLCYNAVDRHLVSRGDQPALIAISATNDHQTYSYRELATEVTRFSAVLKALGVGRGDRVVIFLPTIAEAVVAMLACTRIGALHVVVYSGFAAQSLAARIDDAGAKLLITADAAFQDGKIVPCKRVGDAALRIARRPPGKVLVVNRRLDPTLELVAGRDHEYGALRAAQMNAEVPCEWLESAEPSHILYTSGNAGKPKGILRDTGGYAVALASSMRHIFCVDPGEAMFTTSDVGWVAGHSYAVYGPLLNGATTVIVEDFQARSDPGLWLDVVARHTVRTVLGSPTELRLLRKHCAPHPDRPSLPALAYIFVTGEPLDEATARWSTDHLGVPVFDVYLQTETGWPVLAAQPGIEDTSIRPGSPSFPVYGYDVRLLAETNGKEVTAGSKGVLVIKPPLPPGCGSTIWNDDQRFIQTYYADFPQDWAYSTRDWALRDSDGYHFVLGRTDDVISVGGRRVGTREIEDAVHVHPRIVEAAVVGVPDQVKGHIAVAFAVVRDQSMLADPQAALDLARDVCDEVERQLGAIARPAALHFVPQLPKTRSGKLLRQSVQALAEGREPDEIATIDDPSALERIRSAMRGR